MIFRYKTEMYIKSISLLLEFHCFPVEQYTFRFIWRSIDIPTFVEPLTLTFKFDDKLFTKFYRICFSSRLDDNIEKKEDVFLPLMLLYEYYTETCQLQGVTVVDIPVFMRVCY